MTPRKEMSVDYFVGQQKWNRKNHFAGLETSDKLSRLTFAYTHLSLSLCLSLSLNSSSSVLVFSWSDSTIAGVWRRAARSRSGSVPFSKMVLTKLLVLDNPTRRQDYFRQQSRFVTSQGQADEYAEFSTNIHGKTP